MLCLHGLPSCGPDRHRLLVDLRTDLEGGTDFSSVVNELRHPDGTDARPVSFVALPAHDFDLGVRVAEISGLSRGRHRLVTRLRDPLGEGVASRTTLVSVDGSVAVTVVVYATRDAVHLAEAGSCFEFFAAPAYASFVAFRAPGAPPSDVVGAAFWQDGLYVLPER